MSIRSKLQDRLAARGTKVRQDFQSPFDMDAFRGMVEAVPKAAKAEGERQEVATVAKKLEAKRKPLRLKGRRSTRRTRITPDIFASSLGAPKTLLGG